MEFNAKTSIFCGDWTRVYLLPPIFIERRNTKKVIDHKFSVEKDWPLTYLETDWVEPVDR